MEMRRIIAVGCGCLLVVTSGLALAADRDRTMDRDQVQQKDMSGDHDQDRTRDQDRLRDQDRDHDIYGWELMTAEERVQHREKMRSMKTEKEREAYMKEHHKMMQERAKAKGVTLPEMPGDGMKKGR